MEEAMIDEKEMSGDNAQYKNIVVMALMTR